MKTTAQFLAVALGFVSAAALCHANSMPFHAWQPTPAMGWNSWDCFATTVTEAQVKAEADYMAAHLKPYGWQYIVVDHQWYDPGATGFSYRTGIPFVMDQWGRWIPAPDRFPSAADGTGFKALADYVHGKGLKFGIHILRGIPRQAVTENTPILGTPYHAADIADKRSLCSWCSDMYGVDMSKPGAQAYYDSVYAQFAAWGVDFIKCDDLSQPYHKAEIEAIRRAIDKTGRPIVFSTSPGPTPVSEGQHIEAYANMWRISDDFWDKWSAPKKSQHGLKEQFAPLAAWAPFTGPGHFPDADMLSLGTIDLGKRKTHFTPDEQYTLVTLWCIARSPLIFGGDMLKMDTFTLSLLTNDEVLAVDQHSSGNHQLFNRDGLIAWVADVPGSKDKYLALFNTTDSVAEVSVTLTELGFDGAAAVHVRDLWKRAVLPGSVTGHFAPSLPAHGAGLYRVSPTGNR